MKTLSLIPILSIMIVLVSSESASALTSDRVEERREAYHEERLQLMLDPVEAKRVEFTRKIQTALQNAGYYNGRIDGVSGPQTRQAIKAFQIANDLAVDGLVGPMTWSRLKEYYYSSSAVE